MKNWLAETRRAMVTVLCLAVIVGGFYPTAVWVLAQALFSTQANGSLIRQNGTTLGSRLIAQGFVGPEYFHPRPSAAGSGYDGTSSGGSNLGPISKELNDALRQRLAAYRQENNLNSKALVPVDAVTTSASGLDPDISLHNALIQASRVARARGLSETAVKRLIKKHTQGRDLGILGEPRVNVLILNLALDGKWR